MSLDDRHELGTIKINNEVVATVAGLAASEVDGIAGMAGSLAGGIGEFLGKKNLTKGVKVQVGEKEAACDLFVVVKYGVTIPEVCVEVQRNVKRAIEVMTGLEVVEVNVHVASVHFEDKDQPAEVRVR